MDAAADDASGWGILPGYHDVWGTWREPSAAATRRIRRAMGATTDDPSAPAPAGTPLRIIRAGAGRAPASGLQRGVHPPASVSRRHRSAATASLTLEDGTTLPVDLAALLPDLPLGYHRLEVEAPGAAPTIEHLVVAPGATHPPPWRRAWGITAQLYAARSRASWGMGDLGDLARLASWALDRGARTVGLNPLHASSPVGQPADSPYSPSTRRWADPIYLDVGALAVAAGLPDAADLAATGAQLNASARIERLPIWQHKLAVLERLWQHAPPPDAYRTFRQERGASLTLWGTWCVLAERHGPDWRRWPNEVAHPSRPAVGRVADDPVARDRVDFWCWLQWLVDDQLTRAGAGEVAVTDLAVGFAPDGFDAWEWQDLIAPGVHIGAPPDLLGPDGQDWGLPPFVPWRARGAAYRPLAETLRANLRHAAGLRIDHVMGLLRLFWIPPEMDASAGAYVAWPGQELVDIVALESVRAGAFVVGEDLGTVEPGIRTMLRGAGLLSTRLLWFEEEPPDRWPAQAMAAVTTHDLPTIAGVWSGVDLADQRRAGVTVPDDGDELFRHRLRVAASCDDGAAVDDVVVAAHRQLATAPSILATATLDDLLGAEHRPNVPGTVDEHPNWRIPLPRPIDDLTTDPLAVRVTEAMQQARPQPDQPGR